MKVQFEFDDWAEIIYLVGWFQGAAMIAAKSKEAKAEYESKRDRFTLLRDKQTLLVRDQLTGHLVVGAE